MNQRVLLSALVLLSAFVFVPALVSAQNTAPIRVERLPTPVQSVDAPAADADAARVDADVVDPQGTIDRLRAKNRQLKADNDRLRSSVAELDARISAMTSRGGSLVHAYCEAPNVSRNTAGAEQNCGNFRCNDVSGLCHESCTITDHCSSGICDPVSHTCVPN